MNWVWLLIGLLLPIAMGVQAMCALGISRDSKSLAIGYGVFSGLMFCCLFAWIWGKVGLRYSREPMLLLVVALYGVGLLWLFRWSSRRAAPKHSLDLTSDRLGAHGIVAITALALLAAVHLLPLAAEVLYRPLYPFDATTAWATKAKVWFELGYLAPFVEKSVWLSSSENSEIELFTDHMPHYPIVVPLLQLWGAVMLERWHTSWVNLPWLLCCVSLIFMSFGAARVLGMGVVASSIVTYLVLSVPLLNSHIALAGYADLFMCTCFLGGIVSLSMYLRRPDRRNLLLLVAFLVAGALTKNEGLFWSLSVVVGLLLGHLRKRHALIALIAGGVFCYLAILAFPKDWVVAGHSLEQLGIQLQTSVLHPMVISLFGFGSWHLTFLLFVAGLFALAMPKNKSVDRLFPLFLSLLIAYALFLFLFFFTGYSRGAVLYTAVSRINLALVPATLVLSVASLHGFLFPKFEEARAGRPSGTAS